MLQDFEAINHIDENGNPTGGIATATGIKIDWQNGPLGRGEDRVEPNGAFVETLLAIAKSRLEFYQTANGGKFACRENAMAIDDLNAALGILDERTKSREARQVEGTHTV